MKLPLITFAFLPKRLASKYIQHVWDSKPDKSIIEAFNNATEWIDLSLGIMETPTIVEVAEDCITRLEVFILPQMRKRNLLT